MIGLCNGRNTLSVGQINEHRRIAGGVKNLLRSTFIVHHSTGSEFA